MSVLHSTGASRGQCYRIVILALEMLAEAKIAEPYNSFLILHGTPTFGSDENCRLISHIESHLDGAS
jgi:hypothetical protein